ncbi:MAG TPA: sigma 54-interacting transcriptional regulator [Clostridia bacterium]|nr:sigma 54-interacting transcriptional regulator [Clostridia bacterium]
MGKLNEIISNVQMILDHVHEGVVVADRDYRVVYVNEANQRITGFDNRQILGKYVRDIVPMSSLIEVIATGKERLMNKTWIGSKYVVSNIVPIYDGKEVIGSISVFMDITEIEALNSRLKQAEEKISHLSRQLCRYIGNEEFITGTNPTMQKAFYVAQKASGINSNVLITGESGTGKEVLARFIHNSGLGRQKPFVAVNCGAIPETLLESELFGYEPGAFTGASSHGKAGLFEQAGGGTIFLDEIGDLPLFLQVKFLRVLQDKQVYRLGGGSRINLDVRVIAATNRPLEKMVVEKTFREDLYYRLNVIQINIPPLRERKEDVHIYIKLLLEKLSRTMGAECPRIAPEAFRLLLNYDYPGNIRELANILEKCIVMDEDGVIDTNDLPEALNGHGKNKGLLMYGEQAWPTLRQMEKTLLEKTLSVYPSKSKAAKVLGISRATLYRKIRECGME